MQMSKNVNNDVSMNPPITCAKCFVLEQTATSTCYYICFAPSFFLSTSQTSQTPSQCCLGGIHQKKVQIVDDMVARKKLLGK